MRTSSKLITHLSINLNTNCLILNEFLLKASALKDDFVLILHQDRKEHRIMSYINLMEHLTLAEQEETVKLLCNMCSSPASSNWLMYISEVSLIKNIFAY